jgi:hypothetical protein
VLPSGGHRHASPVRRSGMLGTRGPIRGSGTFGGDPAAAESYPPGMDLRMSEDERRQGSPSASGLTRCGTRSSPLRSMPESRCAMSKKQRAMLIPARPCAMTEDANPWIATPPTSSPRSSPAPRDDLTEFGIGNPRRSSSGSGNLCAAVVSLHQMGGTASVSRPTIAGRRTRRATPLRRVAALPRRRSGRPCRPP